MEQVSGGTLNWIVNQILHTTISQFITLVLSIAECFNYYFPQELDDEFLVIGGNLGGAKYKYMKLNELQEFLSGCIDLGFTFPLNPKWVLCDQGWKALWDKLIGSTHPMFSSVLMRGILLALI